jgi:hypothetical protein
MTKFLNKKINSLIAGTFLSLSKVQESLSQNGNNIENTISIQQEVKKREIKLLSKEKFYNLLEESNMYKKSLIMKPIDEKRFFELSMKKNLNDDEIIEINLLMEKYINLNAKGHYEPKSFNNERFGSTMEDINNLDPNTKHKFETNNDLYKISHYVKLNKTNIDNQVEIDFYINKIENPHVKFIDVTDLSYFKVVEWGKTYSYNVINYLGCISQPNDIDLIYRFVTTIEKNGEYDFVMGVENAILDENNTMSHTTIKFNPNI